MRGANSVYQQAMNSAPDGRSPSVGAEFLIGAGDIHFLAEMRLFLGVK
jgi:hypothetical protein